MNTAPLLKTAPSDRRSMFFWVKRDGSAFARYVRGSISLTVPLDQHGEVLSSECEDWCLDFLTDGLLLEWRGTELHAHFASKIDAVLFRLRWL